MSYFLPCVLLGKGSERAAEGGVWQLANPPRSYTKVCAGRIHNNNQVSVELLSNE